MDEIIKNIIFVIYNTNLVASRERNKTLLYNYEPSLVEKNHKSVITTCQLVNTNFPGEEVDYISTSSHYLHLHLCI